MATPAEDQYLLTPDQFGDLTRSRAEAGYAPFTPNRAGYQQTATQEIQPLYGPIFSQFNPLEDQAIQRTRQSYGDLLNNLREEYNRRGTFFSGEAMGSTQKLLSDQGQAEASVIGDFAGRRASLTLDQNKAINERAGQLADQAFADYNTKRKQEIDTQVMEAVANYLPGYNEKVQQQLADANNPWLDIPLDGESAPAAETAPSGGTTTPPAAGTPRRDLKVEQNRVGVFGRIYGRTPSGKNPAEKQFIRIASYGYTGARDRNKEQKMLGKFGRIFGHMPVSQDDWQILHAMTYSGAK